jgi:protein FAM32A
MDLDEYDLVTKKPLKTLSGEQKAKKKKQPEQVEPSPSATNETPTETEAERAFRLKQEKIAESRILKKAQKTHKQRVEEFNKHLDSLSEHYDIPKVSWTK